MAARRCRTRSLPRRHRGHSHSGVVSVTCRVGTLASRSHSLRPSSLAPRHRVGRPQRRRASAQCLTRRPPTESKNMACLSTGWRAALARRMGRPHRPQRRTSQIAHHMRVRSGLAASRLHTAGRKHRASHPATTPRHDHLIVADRCQRNKPRPAPPSPP
jgi:hypothetical protein